MSDGYEGSHGGKGEGKVRKHHRRSTRTRSRQEKISRPKLNMLNVGKPNKNNSNKKHILCSNIMSYLMYAIIVSILTAGV